MGQPKIRTGGARVVMLKNATGPPTMVKAPHCSLLRRAIISCVEPKGGIIDGTKVIEALAKRHIEITAGNLADFVKMHYPTFSVEFPERRPVKKAGPRSFGKIPFLSPFGSWTRDLEDEIRKSQGRIPNSKEFLLEHISADIAGFNKWSAKFRDYYREHGISTGNSGNA